MFVLVDDRCEEIGQMRDEMLQHASLSRELIEGLERRKDAEDAEGIPAQTCIKRLAA